MAERIRIQFQDQDGDPWRISILDDNHTGAITEAQVLTDDVALTYDGPADETHAPLLGSSLSFSLIRTSAAVDSFLEDLVSAVEGTIRVHLYHNDLRIWLGVILPDTITITEDYLNGTAEITAVDDLSLLSEVKYQTDAGGALEGWDRLTDHLLRILARLRTADDWADGDEFLRVYDHLTAGTDSAYQATSQRAYNIRVNHSSFYTLEDGIYNFNTAEEVLEQIALILGARLFLDGGVWHLLPPWLADISTTLSYYSFSRDGQGFTASGTTDAAVPINVGASRLADGWATTYGPPMRSVYRSQAYLGNVYLFKGDVPSADFSTSISAPNSFDYSVGSQFTIAGTLKIAQDQVLTLTGPDRLVRYKLRVQVMIPGAQVGGTRYFHAPVPDQSSIYALEGYTVGISGGTEQVTIFSPTATSVGSWTTSSSGTGWEIWTPVLRAGDVDLDQDLLSFPFTFTTLPTLTDGQGLAVRVDLLAFTGYVGATGGSGSGINGSLTGTYLGAATYSIQDLRVIFGDGGDNGNVIRYGATVSSASKLRETLDLDQAIIGDVISDNTNGRLQVNIGGTWSNTTRWTSHLHTAGTTVNRLLAQDRLALRQDPLTIIEGTIWRTRHVTPLDVLVWNSDRYVITSITRGLFLGSSQVTAYRIQDNTTDITNPDDDGTIQPVQGVKGDPLIDQDGIAPAGVTAVLLATAAASQVTLQTIQGDIATAATNIDNNTTAITAAEGDIATNTTAISSLGSSLSATQTKLEIIAGTLTPKGVDGATSTVLKYEEDKVDGMTVEITQAATTISSGSGTSSLTISENSPGVLDLTLSDGATTPTGISTIYSTTIGGRAAVGIGLNSITDSGLHVNGKVKIYQTGTFLYELPTTAGSDGQILNRDGATGTSWTASPTLTSVHLTAGLTAFGSISSLTGNISTTTGSITTGSGSISTGSGSITVGGTLTANAAIIGSGGLSFTGGGTSTIGIASALPNQPADLEIRSNGNVDVVLDADSNETGQAFTIKDGTGTVLFSVNQEGITSGALTTPSPTFTAASTYDANESVTISISNYDASITYSGAIYDASGDEVTGSPVTITSGVISFTVPSTIAAGYELRIKGLAPGLFQSAATVATFEIVSPPVGFMDNYTTGAVGAYALALVFGDYDGPCIRVRRTSDNAEQDIGFDGEDLDTSSLASFCAGSDGHIQTLYDQSGNGSHMTQTTSNIQIKIYDDVAGYLGPKIKGDAPDFYNITGAPITGAPFAVAMVATHTNGSNRNIWNANEEGTNVNYFYCRSDANNTFDAAIYGGSFVRSRASVSAGNFIGYAEFLVDGSNVTAQAYVNGTGAGSVSTTPPSSIDVNDLGIFQRALDATYYTEVTALIIYTGDRSSDRDGIISAMNTKYEIYP